MAEICSAVSSFLANTEPSDKDIADLGEKVFMVVVGADATSSTGCNSQFFGRLYDKFHRTGSNS
jgi:hypothetical protein